VNNTQQKTEKEKKKQEKSKQYWNTDFLALLNATFLP
jgi:hypothetical protein